MRRKLQNWFLVFSCVVLLGLGFLIEKQATGVTDNGKVFHTIERLSFGMSPGEFERVKTIGVESYIQSQLNPESIKESLPLKKHLGRLETLNKSSMELFKSFREYDLNYLQKQGRSFSQTEQQQLQRKRGQVKRKAVQETQEGRLAMALGSPRQLQEVMVDFWLNHFNVFIGKRSLAFWVADYEQEIRSQALGSFRDLLGITAHHPAMLFYLDNDLNTDPNSPAAKGNAQGLNENYARELMELHTLGVDGGYTQEDVITLARILTGWGVDFTGSYGNENNFHFYQRRHDSQDKVFLGQKIKGGGIEEGEKALDILASHPSTAKFISYKLAQYFVADEPPSSLVDKLSQKFLETKGDIKSVLDLLFHSSEFNDPQYYQQKFKTPYQYVLSLVRASGIDSPAWQRLQGMLLQLSMPVYQCLTPDGYENTKSAWLNPDAMLQRISFATAIASGALSNKQPVDPQQLQATLGEDLSAATQKTIADTPPKLRAALILGSPEMMNK